MGCEYFILSFIMLYLLLIKHCLQTFFSFQGGVQKKYINYDDLIIVKKTVITMTEETRKKIKRKVSNFLNKSLTETRSRSFLISVEPGGIIQGDPAFE